MATQEASGPISASPPQVDGIWNDENKIVLGIDIGTTCSAVSFVYLVKGQKQAIHRIIQWPGQGEQDQGAKIPTVMWYNLGTKKAELVGAEALSHDGKRTGKKNGWFLVKHFKLHLQPEDQRQIGLKLDPLPSGISLLKIYSDFLRYLLKHTQAFVESSPDRIPLGKQIWEKYKSTMELVVAHPNVWDSPEQDFLRRAAVESGFVDEDSAPRRVQFVTEAEASVHYCVNHSSLKNILEPGTKLAVCDAGGSTIDTTLYSVISTTPVVQLREVRLPDSIQAGGIFVNREFETYMRQVLKGLKLNQAQVDDFMSTADEDFEFVSKRKFGGEIDPTSSGNISTRVANASFNRHGNNTTKARIRRGRLDVPVSTITECFDVSVTQILSSHVLLVGGFGDSPYLRTRFKGHLGSDDREVVLANDSTAKAVADGSVLWNTLCSVIARTPRRSFGMICGVPCLPWIYIPGSEGRNVYIGPDGVPTNFGAWSQVVKKGVPLDADAVFRENCKHPSAEPNPTSIELEVELVGYSGDDEPIWAWDKNEKLLPRFKEICTITAKLYNLEGALKPAISMTGVNYWYLDVEVCIHFGTTELQAHLEWMQNGIRRKGPATVVPGRPIDL